MCVVGSEHPIFCFYLHTCICILDSGCRYGDAARPGPAAAALGSQDVPLIHLSHAHTHSAHTGTASPGWSATYTDNITRLYAHGTTLHLRTALHNRPYHNDRKVQCAATIRWRRSFSFRHTI